MKYIKLFEYDRPFEYSDGKFYDLRYINDEHIISENLWYYAEILSEVISEFINKVTHDRYSVIIKRTRKDSRLVLFVEGCNFIDFMDDTKYGKDKGLQLMFSEYTSSEIKEIRDYLISILSDKKKKDNQLIFINFKSTEKIKRLIKKIDFEDYLLKKDVEKYNL